MSRTLEEDPGSATGLSETELLFAFVANIFVLDDVFRMHGFSVMPLLLLPLLFGPLIVVCDCRASTTAGRQKERERGGVSQNVIKFYISTAELWVT